jgi:hypothetical protein
VSRPALCFLMAAALIDASCADPTAPRIGNAGGVGTNSLTVQAWLYLTADSSLSGLTGTGTPGCRVYASVLVSDSLGMVNDATIRLVAGARDTVPFVPNLYGVSNTGSREVSCRETYSLTVFHGADSIADVDVASPGAPVVLAPGGGDSVPADARLNVWWLNATRVSLTQTTEISAAPVPVVPTDPFEIIIYPPNPPPVWVDGNPGRATAPAGWLGSFPAIWRLTVTTSDRVAITGGRGNSFVWITASGDSRPFCVGGSCFGSRVGDTGPRRLR